MLKFVYEFFFVKSFFLRQKLKYFFALAKVLLLNTEIIHINVLKYLIFFIDHALFHICLWFKTIGTMQFIVI